MANHKRKKAKHQRAGCLYCKPHKDEREKGSEAAQTLQEQKSNLDVKEFELCPRCGNYGLGKFGCEFCDDLNDYMGP